MDNVEREKFLENVYDLEKERILQFKMKADFSHMVIEKKENLDNEVRECSRGVKSCSSQLGTIRKNMEDEINKLTDSNNKVIFITITIVLFIAVLLSIVAAEMWNGRAALLFIVVFCLVIGGPIILLNFLIFRHSVKHTKEQGSEKMQPIEAELKQRQEELEQITNQNRVAFEQFVAVMDAETKRADENIRKLESALMKLYTSNSEMPSEFFGDFPAVAAIKHYLDSMGDYSREQWRLSIFHGERVKKLRGVQIELNRFEDAMNELESDIRDELESIALEYRMEVAEHEQELLEANAQFGEERGKILRRFDEAAQLTYRKAMTYLSSY